MSSKIRGAAEVLHGIGDNLRGRFMDGVDRTPSSHSDLAQKGRLEVEQGFARIRGNPIPSVSSGSGSAATVGAGGQAGNQEAGIGAQQQQYQPAAGQGAGGTMPPQYAPQDAGGYMGKGAPVSGGGYGEHHDPFQSNPPGPGSKGFSPEGGPAPGFNYPNAGTSAPARDPKYRS